ncbi:MAG: hypothetical protein Kow0092_16270 [Deferrisomatales bacterium]
MKVVWSEAFRQVYTGDPAAAPGRLEPAVAALEGRVEWVAPEPASREALLRCHTPAHLEWVEGAGVYEIAALAAGAAIEAARLGRREPAFAPVRPPGHHASADRAWGFCYFNNLAVAVTELRQAGHAGQVLVVDFDLHFGDGTVNLLGGTPWATLVNPGAPTPREYLYQVGNALEEFEGDLIAVSAGFDNHREDWGGLLATEDYRRIGRHVGTRARTLGAACFGVLEGGYNPAALADSLRAFVQGLEQGWAGGAADPPTPARAR